MYPLRWLIVLTVVLIPRSETHTRPWHPDSRTPSDIMVDVVNNLGLNILKIHNTNNENNIAISPYGLASILTVLLEGVRGRASLEIQKCGGFPSDKDVIRVGLRDIHRLLRSYFIPQEGFLSGLSLSSEKVILRPEYQSILRFYGFDMTSFNTPIYPDLKTTTSMSNVTTLLAETTEYTETTSGTTTLRPTTQGDEGETTVQETTTQTTTEATTRETTTEATTVTSTRQPTTTQLPTTQETTIPPVTTTTVPPETSETKVITVTETPTTTLPTTTTKTTLETTLTTFTTTKLPETTSAVSVGTTINTQTVATERTETTLSNFKPTEIISVGSTLSLSDIIHGLTGTETTLKTVDSTENVVGSTEALVGTKPASGTTESGPVTTEGSTKIQENTEIIILDSTEALTRTESLAALIESTVGTTEANIRTTDVATETIAVKEIEEVTDTSETTIETLESTESNIRITETTTSPTETTTNMSEGTETTTTRMLELTTETTGATTETTGATTETTGATTETTGATTETTGATTETTGATTEMPESVTGESSIPSLRMRRVGRSIVTTSALGNKIIGAVTRASKATPGSAEAIRSFAETTTKMSEGTKRTTGLKKSVIELPELITQMTEASKKTNEVTIEVTESTTGESLIPSLRTRRVRRSINTTNALENTMGAIGFATRGAPQATSKSKEATRTPTESTRKTSEGTETTTSLEESIEKTGAITKNFEKSSVPLPRELIVTTSTSKNTRKAIEIATIAPETTPESTEAITNPMEIITKTSDGIEIINHLRESTTEKPKLTTEVSGTNTNITGATAEVAESTREESSVPSRRMRHVGRFITTSTSRNTKEAIGIATKALNATPKNTEATSPTESTTKTSEGTKTTTGLRESITGIPKLVIQIIGATTETTEAAEESVPSPKMRHVERSVVGRSTSGNTKEVTKNPVKVNIKTSRGTETTTGLEELTTIIPESATKMTGATTKTAESITEASSFPSLKMRRVKRSIATKSISGKEAIGVVTKTPEAEEANSSSETATTEMATEITRSTTRLSVGTLEIEANVSPSKITTVPLKPRIPEVSEGQSESLSGLKRIGRSIVDYFIAKYYDNQNPDIYPHDIPPEKKYTFLVGGKYQEPHVHFMTYDAILPFFYVHSLNALALRFPLDSPKYYLLLVLPVDEDGIDRLICDIGKTATLKQITSNLRPTYVRAVIPSFSLRGFVILTSSLQKIGIRQIFEPRHSDFSPMTEDQDIYVTNIEQAITVMIKNYMDQTAYPKNRDQYQYGPVEFKATHPFLYFVMDAEIDVTLVAGKVVNPINSRIQ